MDGMRGSVLVVDDDPSIRRLVRLILVDAGFDVFLAADGLEALGMMERVRPCVVVLDMKMPVMDGETFMKELGQEHRPHVLLLSGEITVDKVKAEVGADASLSKPFMPEDLVDKVTELSTAA